MFDEGILNMGLIDNTVNDCENETEKRHRDFFSPFPLRDEIAMAHAKSYQS